MMTNKPPYADDNGIVNNSPTQNQIRNIKSSKFKIKSTNVRVQRLKHLFNIIIYAQLVCFANSWLYNKNQKLDTPANVAHKNEIHTIPDQLVVINCFLKVHLTSENNDLLLFHNDNEAEIKKSLVAYLDDLKEKTPDL